MRYLLAAGLVLTLAACSRGERSSADTTRAGAAGRRGLTGGDSGAVRAANTDAGTGAAAVIRASLTGGKAAGTYNATAPGVICRVDSGATNGWSVMFSDTTVRSGLSGVRIVIPDIRKASAGTPQFYLSLVIGSFIQGTDYTIETRASQPRRGEGTATARSTGSTAHITVKGTTANKVVVNVEVQCNRVESAV